MMFSAHLPIHLSSLSNTVPVFDLSSSVDRARWGQRWLSQLILVCCSAVTNLKVRRSFLVLFNPSYFNNLNLTVGRSSLFHTHLYLASILPRQHAYFRHI